MTLNNILEISSFIIIGIRRWKEPDRKKNKNEKTAEILWRLYRGKNPII